MVIKFHPRRESCRAISHNKISIYRALNCAKKDPEHHIMWGEESNSILIFYVCLSFRTEGDLLPLTQRSPVRLSAERNFKFLLGTTIWRDGGVEPQSLVSVLIMSGLNPNSQL